MPIEKSVILPETQMLQFKSSKHAVSYGTNQEMFTSFWKRKSGCGPSTAANMFMYASWNKSHSAKNMRLCGERAERFNEHTVLQHMENAWKHITPGLGGVKTAAKFAGGAREYAYERGLNLDVRFIDVPGKRGKANLSFEAFISFIFNGLKSGCPVAFLNLCKGNVKNLDGWHWVTIMGLYQEGNNYFATIFDEGNKKEIDMNLWYKTNKRGGGLVYFDLAETSNA